MWKQALVVVGETMLLLVVFVLFSVVLPGLGTIPTWRVHVSAVHDYVPTGMAAMVVVWGLLVAAGRGRWRAGAGRATLALVLAFCLGLALKVGFVEPLVRGVR